MKRLSSIRAGEEGAAAIEMAFALPVLVLLIWIMVQLGQMYQALAGMQHALGEGARYATLCINPTATGCAVPTPTQITARINAQVYGTGSGQFNVPLPVKQTAGTSSYYDLQVNYTQPTSLLVIPGPNISLSRSKRVWVAGA